MVYQRRLLDLLGGSESSNQRRMKFTFDQPIQATLLDDRPCGRTIISGGDAVGFEAVPA